MRVLRWLAATVLVALALAFALGHPVRWGEAALMIWDIAAGGRPTLWQTLTAPPNE
jgi:hypothetical protein